MFLGHFGVAFAAKRAEPRLSLGTLVAAAIFVDLLWPLFLILGLEHVAITPGITVMTPLDFHDYPITHSLVGAGAWSVVFGLMVYGVTRIPRKGLVGGFVVFSHWLLDLLVHRPDLPLLSNNGPKFGLGAWNSMPLTLILELGMLALGVWLYVRATPTSSARGRWTLIGFVAFLLAIYAANIMGPPPPSAEAIGYVGLSMWLFVLFGYYVDKQRRTQS